MTAVAEYLPAALSALFFAWALTRKPTQRRYDRER